MREQKELTEEYSVSIEADRTCALRSAMLSQLIPLGSDGCQAALIGLQLLSVGLLFKQQALIQVVESSRGDRKSCTQK